MAIRRNSASLIITEIVNAGTSALLNERTDFKAKVKNQVLTFDHGLARTAIRAGVGHDVPNPDALPYQATSFCYPNGSDPSCNGMGDRPGTILDYTSISENYRTQLFSTYWPGNQLYFRTQNGDSLINNVGTWNTWDRIFHTGNPPTARETGIVIDINSGSNGAITWNKLATVTLPQTSEIVSLLIMGGSGFNVGQPYQATETNVLIRPGNNNPQGIDVVVYANNTSSPFLQAGWKHISGNTYEIYVQLGSYTGNLVCIPTASKLASVSVEKEFSLLPEKPAGLTDAYIYTFFHTGLRQRPKYFDDVPGSDYQGLWITGSATNYKKGINFSGTEIGNNYSQIIIDSNGSVTTSSTTGSTVTNRTLFTTDGGDINNSIRVRGVSGGLGQVDLRHDSFTLGLRNDGVSFYLLTTNKNDPDGTWNNLRPFKIDLATGNVSLGSTVNPDGALMVKGDGSEVVVNGAKLLISPGNSTWIGMKDNNCVKNKTSLADGSAQAMVVQEHSQRFFMLGGCGEQNFGLYLINKSTTTNTTDAAATLGTDGTFYCAHNGNFNDVYIRSDIRLKDNFTEMNNPTERLMGLVTCFYDKYDSLSHRKKLAREFGIIAQSLNKTLPEAVTKSTDADRNEILSISNSAINGLIVNYLQKLNNGIKEEFNNLRGELGLPLKSKFIWE